MFGFGKSKSGKKAIPTSSGALLAGAASLPQGQGKGQGLGQSTAKADDDSAFQLAKFNLDETIVLSLIDLLEVILSRPVHLKDVLRSLDNHNAEHVLETCENIVSGLASKSFLASKTTALLWSCFHCILSSVKCKTKLGSPHLDEQCLLQKHFLLSNYYLFKSGQITEMQTAVANAFDESHLKLLGAIFAAVDILHLSSKKSIDCLAHLLFQSLTIVGHGDKNPKRTSKSEIEDQMGSFLYMAFHASKVFDASYSIFMRKALHAMGISISDIIELLKNQNFIPIEVWERALKNPVTELSIDESDADDAANELKTLQMQQLVTLPTSASTVDAYAVAEQHIADLERRMTEEHNLLRYKIEVLVNLLAIEEQKSAAMQRRLDSAKMMMLARGFTDESIRMMTTSMSMSMSAPLILGNSLNTSTSMTPISHMDPSVSPGNFKYSRKYYEKLSFDMARAMEKMADEFTVGNGSGTSGREDILHAYADENGKIAPVLSRDDFMRQLYHATTENLDKADVQMISMRFLIEDNRVSVTEFLDYFLSPQSVRQAKTATAAVRMSLEYLQIDSLPKNGESESEFDTNNENNASSINSQPYSETAARLEAAIDKLVANWDALCPAVERRFSELMKESRRQLITAEEFKASLANCKLDSEEVQLLCNKFEICDSVHCGQFLQFMKERCVTGRFRKHSFAVPVATGRTGSSLSVSSSFPSSSSNTGTVLSASSEWTVLKTKTIESYQQQRSRNSSVIIEPPQQAQAAVSGRTGEPSISVSKDSLASALKKTPAIADPPMQETKNRTETISLSVNALPSLSVDSSASIHAPPLKPPLVKSAPVSTSAATATSAKSYVPTVEPPDTPVLETNDSNSNDNNSKSGDIVTATAAKSRPSMFSMAKMLLPSSNTRQSDKGSKGTGSEDERDIATSTVSHSHSSNSNGQEASVSQARTRTESSSDVTTEQIGQNDNNKKKGNVITRRMSATVMKAVSLFKTGNSVTKDKEKETNTIEHTSASHNEQEHLSDVTTKPTAGVTGGTGGVPLSETAVDSSHNPSNASPSRQPSSQTQNSTILGKLFGGFGTGSSNSNKPTPGPADPQQTQAQAQAAPDKVLSANSHNAAETGLVTEAETLAGCGSTTATSSVTVATDSNSNSNSNSNSSEATAVTTDASKTNVDAAHTVITTVSKPPRRNSGANATVTADFNDNKNSIVVTVKDQSQNKEEAQIADMQKGNAEQSESKQQGVSANENARTIPPKPTRNRVTIIGRDASTAEQSQAHNDRSESELDNDDDKDDVKSNQKKASVTNSTATVRPSTPPLVNASHINSDSKMSTDDSSKPSSKSTSRDRAEWVHDIQSACVTKFGTVRDGAEMLTDLFLSMDADDTLVVSETQLVKALESMRLGFTRLEIKQLYECFEQPSSSSGGRGFYYNDLLDEIHPPPVSISTTANTNTTSPILQNDSKHSTTTATTIASAINALRDSMDRKLGSVLAGADRLLDLCDGMDVNEDGTLSAREFKSALDKLKIDLSAEEIRVLMNEFDVDKTGFMNYKMLLEVLGSNAKSNIGTTPPARTAAAGGPSKTVTYSSVDMISEFDSLSDDSGDDDHGSYNIRSKPSANNRSSRK